MTKKPEQLKALAYLERKGTQQPLPVVLEKVSTAFESLERLLESFDAETAQKRLAEDQWSVFEVVDHLVVSHRPVVRQLREALRGKSPGEAIPAHLQSQEPKLQDWSQLVQELKSIHTSFLTELNQAKDDVLASEIPVAMVIKAAASDGSLETVEWTEKLHWKAFAIGTKAHTLEHLAQIQRIKDALASAATA